MDGSELTSQSDDQRVHGSTIKELEQRRCKHISRECPNDISPERQFNEDNYIQGGRKSCTFFSTAYLSKIK